MIVINNTLYLFGGYGKDGMLNLWKYDVSKNTTKIDVQTARIKKSLSTNVAPCNKNKRNLVLGGLK